jgi:hypothetical protein
MRSQLGNGGKEMTVVHTVAWRSTVGLADVGGATVAVGELGNAFESVGAWIVVGSSKETSRGNKKGQPMVRCCGRCWHY